jgi:anti-sigma regulatory factor (Ser/Thr protein kinase)
MNYYISLGLGDSLKNWLVINGFGEAKSFFPKRNDSGKSFSTKDIILFVEISELQSSYARILSYWPRQKLIVVCHDSPDVHMDFIARFSIAHVFHFPRNLALSLETEKRLIQVIENKYSGIKTWCNDSLINSHRIQKPSDIDDVTQIIMDHFRDEIGITKIRTTLIETLTNAFFYGARDEDPRSKFEWNLNCELSEDKAVELHFCSNSELIVFSIIDKGGKINPNNVLHWLNRQSTLDDTGLPMGILDTHGRGLFITRKLLDYFFINYSENQFTECVLIQYRNSAPNQTKHISILEVPFNAENSKNKVPPLSESTFQV